MKNILEIISGDIQRCLDKHYNNRGFMIIETYDIIHLSFNGKEGHCLLVSRDNSSSITLSFYINTGWIKR